jgi:ribosomal protein S18 acetylase RimI-like enzyme
VIEVIDADPVHLDAVRRLWSAYWDELGFTPCFQGFEQELANLPGKYAKPDGRLLVAMEDGRSAGAIALRRFDETACEAKRLYVDPAFRGRGIAKLLMERLMSEARAVGYRRIIGDTMPVMAAALAWYERIGFRRTGPYAGATDGAIYIEYPL